jgi:hypothetical protein
VYDQDGRLMATGIDVGDTAITYLSPDGQPLLTVSRAVYPSDLL